MAGFYCLDHLSDSAGSGVFDALVPTGELDDYSRREMRVMGRLAAGITLAGTRLDAMNLPEVRLSQRLVRRGRTAHRSGGSNS
jgi:hypothetical protein